MGSGVGWGRGEAPVLGVKTLVCHSLPSLSPPWLLCSCLASNSSLNPNPNPPNSDEHCHKCLIWQGMKVGDVEVVGCNLQGEAG